MRLRLLGLGGTIVAVVLATECKENPTASLAGQPALISISTNPGFLFEGGATGTVVVRVLDASSTPLPGPVTATTTAPTVATVAPANVNPDPTNTKSVFTVTSGIPGPAYIRFSGQGLTDSMRVNVLPLAFGGALSSTTKAGGDTLTIDATSVLKFDPLTAAVAFGKGDPGTVVVAAAESLRVLVPFSAPDPLSISGIALTYVPGTEVTLPTTATFTQAGDFWGGDSSWRTAPDITPVLPAAGKSAKMIAGLTPAANTSVCPEAALGFGSSGPCMMFKFTWSSTDSLDFTVDWQGGAVNPDIDIYLCSDSTVANFGATCFEDGGAGATASKPQSTGNFALPAGTHYFVIEVFANTGSNGNSRNYFVTIQRK